MIDNEIYNRLVKYRELPEPHYFWKDRIIASVKWGSKIFSGKEWFEQVLKSHPKGTKFRVSQLELKPLNKKFNYNVKEIRDIYIKNMRYNIERYKKQNGNKFICNINDTAIICGGGNSVKDNADILLELKRYLPIITTSCSQNYIEGDYYVACEWRKKGYERIRNAETKETVGAFNINAHPDYTKEKEWKEVFYYSYGNYIDNGMPKFYPYLSVIFDAIQFAIKILGVREIVLIGCEHAWKDDISHPDNKTDNKNYIQIEGIKTARYLMHNAQNLESHCYLLNKEGFQIWNCSGYGIAVRNMALVTLDSFFKLYLRSIHNELATVKR